MWKFLKLLFGTRAAKKQTDVEVMTVAAASDGTLPDSCDLENNLPKEHRAVIVPKPQNEAIRVPMSQSFKGPDGNAIVNGPYYTPEENIVGYNLPPQHFNGLVKPGEYVIPRGTMLELLQCEKPSNAPDVTAPFRWPEWDTEQNVGVIWVYVKDLFFVSGEFGPKV